MGCLALVPYILVGSSSPLFNQVGGRGKCHKPGFDWANTTVCFHPLTVPPGVGLIRSIKTVAFALHQCVTAQPRMGLHIFVELRVEDAIALADLQSKLFVPGSLYWPLVLLTFWKISFVLGKESVRAIAMIENCLLRKLSIACRYRQRSKADPDR